MNVGSLLFIFFFLLILSIQMLTREKNRKRDRERERRKNELLLGPFLCLSSLQKFYTMDRKYFFLLVEQSEMEMKFTSEKKNIVQLYNDMPNYYLRFSNCEELFDI